MNSSKRTLNQFMMNENSMDDNILKIGAHELGGKFKSKLDIYTYLNEILGYYLPPIEGVNREYLRLILRGEKKLFKMDQVKMTKVPKYDELSVKSLFQQVNDDPDIKKYLPDMDEKSKPIDRQYFFNIINTIQPEYLSLIIKKARDTRNNLDEQGRKDYILISDEWYSQLTSHPFISSIYLQLLMFLFREIWKDLVVIESLTENIQTKKAQADPSYSDDSQKIQRDRRLFSRKGQQIE